MAFYNEEYSNTRKEWISNNRLSPKSLLKINICYAHNFISLNRKNGISFTPLN